MQKKYHEFLIQLLLRMEALLVTLSTILVTIAPIIATEKLNGRFLI